jgi:hypothetical protein
MKKSLLLPLAMACSLQLFSQTADEIINKHITAMGGAEKLKSIQSVYIDGTAVTQNGMEIETKTWRVKGQLYRQEIDFGMGTVAMIVTPVGGWSRNPQGGDEFKPMPAEMQKALQAQMDPGSPFVDYAAKGAKIELAGKDTVAGNECYKIKYSPAEGAPVFYSIDEKTFYILKEVRTGGRMGGGAGGGRGDGGGGNGGGRPGGGGLSIEFSDYKKGPDGFIFPYTLILGGFGAKTSVTKLEVNQVKDVATLSQPK